MAVAALKAAEPEIARSAQKGIVHANVAARKVSPPQQPREGPQGLIDRSPASLWIDAAAGCIVKSGSLAGAFVCCVARMVLSDMTSVCHLCDTERALAQAL